jgi:GTP cyclohydrolase I
VDLPAAERAVADLLAALDEDPTSEHLSDTPRRVAQPYTEQLTPREFDLTTSPTTRATTSWYLQVQERLTQQGADALQEHLIPKVPAW